MGIGLQAPSVGQSKYVTSTVASVGPYRLMSRAPVCPPQNRLNRLTCSGESASPLANTRRTEARLEAAPSPLLSRYSRKTLSIEGTKCSTLTLLFLIVLTMPMGLRSAPGGR